MMTQTLLSRIAQPSPNRPAFVRPPFLNLQAIDTSNSRLVTCIIWKNRQREKRTLEALRPHLAPPFFSEVAHVGNIGEEPTLRNNLADLYRLLPQCLGGASAARKCCERVLQLEPGHALARENLGALILNPGRNPQL